MKSIVVFFENKCNTRKNEKVFDGKAAVELSKAWAESVSEKVLSVCADNVTQLLEKLKAACEENKADSVIYSYDDLPFLNKELTLKLKETHEKYCAEYTFADGYPYGFAPEIIDAGTVNILYELSKTVQAEEGKKSVCRESIFNLIKTDINSFEVETVLSEEDFRLLRLNFHCGKKESFIACQKFFEAVNNKGDIEKLSALELSKLAAKNPEILKTVPGFYNIQIADNCGGKCIYCPYAACYEEKNGLKPEKATKVMSFSDFSSLIDKIVQFSEEAVVGLSAWGEPLKHPELLKMIEKVLSYKGLSVFIETDGLLADQNFCNSLAAIVQKAEERTNGWEKVMIAVSVDAFTAETYKKMHGLADSEAFSMETVVEVIKRLSDAVSGAVYPQFVRTNDNEEELESFFRYWNEKSNASGGKQIIQKYDSFAGLLPDCKPADLSPIERNVCWHLRRDMTILSNGDVPFCREYVFSGVTGNAFKESLESIWKKTDSVLIEQMSNQYNNKCRDCDEYYTFNF